MYVSTWTWGLGIQLSQYGLIRLLCGKWQLVIDIRRQAKKDKTNGR